MKKLWKTSLAVLMTLIFPAFAVAEGENWQPNVNEDEPTEEQSWFVDEYAAFRPLWKRLQYVPLEGSPWFSVYRLPENVYAIFEPYLEEQVISYLILGDNAALLWDTGLGIGNIDNVSHRIISGSHPKKWG